MQLAALFLVISQPLPGSGLEGGPGAEPSPAPRTSELAWAPEEGLALRRRFAVEAEYELVEGGLSLDGEAVADAADFRITTREEIVVQDLLVRLSAERPLELRRTFEDLQRDTLYFPDSEDEEARTIERASDLEGNTVRFRWDEEREEYRVTTEDDFAPELLEHLAEDMDLRDLLPTESIEEGESWSFDGRAYLGLMWPGGLLGFYDREVGEVDDGDQASNEQVIESLSGSGLATWTETRTEGELTVAVLQVEIEVAAEAEIEFERGDFATRSIAIERTLRGQIFWNLTHGHLHRLDVRADSRLESVTSGTIQSPDGTKAVVQTQIFGGKMHYTGSVERLNEPR